MCAVCLSTTSHWCWRRHLLGNTTCVRCAKQRSTLEFSAFVFCVSLFPLLCSSSSPFIMPLCFLLPSYSRSALLCAFFYFSIDFVICAVFLVCLYAISRWPASIPLHPNSSTFNFRTLLRIYHCSCISSRQLHDQCLRLRGHLGFSFNISLIPNCALSSGHGLYAQLIITNFP